MPQRGLVPSMCELDNGPNGPFEGVWLSAQGGTIGSVAHGASNGTAHTIYTNGILISEIAIRIDGGGAGRTADVGLWVPDKLTGLPDRQIFYRSGLDASAVQWVSLTGLAIRTPRWIWAGVSPVGGAVTFWNVGTSTVAEVPVHNFGAGATPAYSNVNLPMFDGRGVYGDWGARGSVWVNAGTAGRIFVKGRRR